MSNTKNWIDKRLKIGWIMFSIGAIICIAGITSELKITNRPFDFRIITGLGILLLGIGIGQIVRYRIAAKDGIVAKRIAIEEHDERTVLIRAKAGNRAYWVSTGLVYILLMWISFASNGKLVYPNENILWYFLALAIVLPFGIYLISILRDERSS